MPFPGVRRSHREGYRDRRVITLFENPGTADIYTFAVDNALWHVFQPATASGGVHVPGSAWQVTTIAEGSSPQAQVTGWNVVDVEGATAICLQYLSKVTQVTGGVTSKTAASSPLRIFAQGLWDGDDDPDFSLPPAAALGILDGAVGLSANSQGTQPMAVALMPGDAAGTTSGYHAAIGGGTVSASGLVCPAALNSNVNQRAAWSVMLAGRMSARTTAPNQNDPILQPVTWGWDRLALQMQASVTSAAATNDIATLRVKCQIKLILFY